MKIMTSTHLYAVPNLYEFLCSVELLEDILKNVGLITQLMV